MPNCAEADARATALFVFGEEPPSFLGTVYWNDGNLWGAATIF